MVITVPLQCEWVPEVFSGEENAPLQEDAGKHLEQLVRSQHAQQALHIALQPIQTPNIHTWAGQQNVTGGWNCFNWFMFVIFKLYNLHKFKTIYKNLKHIDLFILNILVPIAITDISVQLTLSKRLSASRVRNRVSNSPLLSCRWQEKNIICCERFSIMNSYEKQKQNSEQSIQHS